MSDEHDGLMEPIQRLDRDLRSAAKMMGKKEIRFLVDGFYTAQENRIRADSQVKACGEVEPKRLLEWIADSERRFEGDFYKALDTFTDEYTIGRWMKSICGIGPVISAGLLAHLDISRCQTAGHFWRFAGLDPTVVWGKGEKRPWNTPLKTLAAFKLGECFVKVQNNKKDFYGAFFRERRDQEEARNAAGANREASAEILKSKRWKKDTEAYKAYSVGLFPPAHLHARARRWAVKLFLSHLHHVMYVDWFGKDPPVPYAFDKCPGDHRHYIAPPNWPFEDKAKSLTEMRE